MTKHLIVPVRPKTALRVYVGQLTPRLERVAGFYARQAGLDRDDLLQEAFCGMIEAWQCNDERIGEPRQFLIGHARWRLLSYARRARYRRMPRIPGDLPRVDEQLAAADLRLDIAFAQLQMTPVQQRIVACLCAGMTWREAGRRLSCTSANIAYHVRQIRGNLGPAA